MIQRINFFYKKSSGFTYRLMLQISVLIFILLLLGNLFENYRFRTAKQKLELVEQSLKTEKLKLQNTRDPKQIDLNSIEKISLALIEDPGWENALRALAQSASEGLWLEEIRGEIGSLKQNSSSTTNTEKISEFEPHLWIQGSGVEAQLIPQFLDRLRNHAIFSKVELLSSESKNNQEQAGLKFDIQVQIH